MNERERLEQAIAHLKSQRAALGDDIVETALVPLRRKLSALSRAIDRRAQQITVLVARASPTEGQAVNITKILLTDLEPIIREHHGHIEKQTGGTIVVSWGKTSSVEFPPEQAIRAALTIREQVERWRSGAESSQDPSRLLFTIDVHIGIHTTTIHASGAGTSIGDIVLNDLISIALYLGQAAPSGEILISHDTYRHVRGVFDVCPQAPLEMPGDPTFNQWYLVDRVKDRTFHLGTKSVEGIETRMVGRDAELDYLRSSLQAVIRENLRQMVTIIGDDGIGKSRLLHEFETWMELLPERIFYLKGRAARETQKLPFALVRDLFSFRFQIRDGDRANVVQEKVERGIQEMLGQPEEQRASQLRSHFIGHLLGFDFSDSVHIRDILVDAEQVRDRAQIYLSDYLKAATERWPTVILLEDIDRADDSSLDALSHLTATTSAQPLLIVCTARSTFFEKRPQWSEAQSLYMRLDLPPLSDRDSRQLVEEILQGMEAVPQILVEFIIGKAQGNPLLIEELLKLLIESSVIVKEEGYSWVDPPSLIAMQIPPTLGGVVQERLDRLSPKEQIILRCASIIGDVFEQDAIQHLLSKEDQLAFGVDVAQVLERLCHRELIVPRPASTVAGTTLFAFKHPLLRELIQESTLPLQRQTYHARAATWLIERSGERSGEMSALLPITWSRPVNWKKELPSCPRLANRLLLSLPTPKRFTT